MIEAGRDKPALSAAQQQDLHDLHEFLGVPTPQAWIQAAVADLPLLLQDHANCEKKAASTAVAMLFRYDDRPRLVAAMSRLAREELRHFEQVLGVMAERGVVHQELSASRYAAGLRSEVRHGEPGRLLDLLVCGALVEARSCERFAALLPYLDARLAAFYARLVRSEARHFHTYLDLAADLADADELAARITHLRSIEQALISEPDDQLRFHSGPPAQIVDPSSNISSSSCPSSALA